MTAPTLSASQRDRMRAARRAIVVALKEGDRTYEALRELLTGPGAHPRFTVRDFNRGLAALYTLRGIASVYVHAHRRRGYRLLPRPEVRHG